MMETDLMIGNYVLYNPQEDVFSKEYLREPYPIKIETIDDLTKNGIHPLLIVPDILIKNDFKKSENMDAWIWKNSDFSEFIIISFAKDLDKEYVCSAQICSKTQLLKLQIDYVH